MPREMCPDYMPDEERREVFGECCICGMDIFVGDYYYDIDGDYICEEHLKDYADINYKTIADHKEEDD